MSIRRRLLFWLLTSVLAGGLLAAGVVFFQALGEASEIFDYQLRQVALTLRDRSFNTAALAEALQGDEALDLAIQVWSSDGSLLYDSLPGAGMPSFVQIGFSTVALAGGAWRVYAVQQRGLTIQVSQPVAVRDRLAAQAAWRIRSRATRQRAEREWRDYLISTLAPAASSFFLISSASSFLTPSLRG